MGLTVAAGLLSASGADAAPDLAAGPVSSAQGVTTRTAAPPAKPCPTQRAHPWCDRGLGAVERAELFLDAMSQDEKISFVGGQGMGAAPHTGGTYAIPRLGLREIYFTDGPAGVRQGTATAMPIPMALGATFSPDLARAYGATVADEAKKKGNDVVYAPTVNILRTPQNGRTYESYGEDPFLLARTGVEWIKGAQATGVIANIKHYAANNQEGFGGVPPITSVDGGRMLVDVNVSYRALRETYLPQFEAAVKQGRVGTVMCAYNRVNGSYACQNRLLLQTILRQQWGFRGFVLSDYGASKDTVRDMNRGLDFVPFQGVTDQSYGPELIRLALASGAVSQGTLESHVRRMLQTFFAFGLFDRRAFRNDDSRIDRAAHRRLAREVEERAITLLKNDGVLPLRRGVESVAVIGPYADRFVTGGGSGTVSAVGTITALDGITRRAQRRGRDITVTHADGGDRAEAVRLARKADVAILVVGDVQTEGQDKDCIGLNCPADFINSNGVLFLQGSTCLQQSCPLNGFDQDGLIDAVADAQPDTVVVLETGGPVLTPWRDDVAAVVEAWYPGQAGGTAIASVLFGDVDPGGRLPATFPASASQLPTAGDRRLYPGILEEVSYAEGLRVGYKWYDAKGLEPAYEFGAGLSYTTFRYGRLRVKRAPGGAGESDVVATATLRVTNTGRRTGVAVPQLYVAKPARRGLRQVPRQLVGYASTEIRAGRSLKVAFPLNQRTFASWTGKRSGWRAVRGCYRLSVGKSSRDLKRRAVVSRGADCERSRLRLGRKGDVDLPLPPVARVRSLAGNAQ
jgi:beta-glucosidase